MAEKIIETENLTYSYGDKIAIDHISFSVKKGEILGFLGPNGAGKTTTVKTLVKINKGYGGSVKVFGKDLKDLGKDYYQKIGVSFEFPAVYSKMSALENLDFFASFYKNHLDPSELLKMIGLEKDQDKLVGEFSKGMKKKLDLARALLPDPVILFLDEPLEGLDPASARKIKDLLLEMKENGKTIFLTTHNMYVADELCDRVVFLVEGKIRLIDNPKELKIKMGKRVVRIEYIQNEMKTKEFPLEGLGQNEEFFEIIRNYEIRSIHTLEPTLEDVFLKVTGRRLV